MEPAWYPALFATGLVAGFVDAIAGGGGLLTVPVLLACGLSPQDALGTNKFQSVCGTLVATYRYARHGLLKWDGMSEGVWATLAGAALGAWTVTRISPAFLRPCLPVLLMAIALYTWLKPDLGRERRKAHLPARWFGVGFGLLLGFYDGFFGPGTGTFWMVACVLLLGLDLLQATAYTKVMNLTSNLASLAVFLVTHHVRFDVALTMAAGQIIGGHWGAYTAVKGGVRVIRPLFLTMAMALAGKLAWEAWRSSR